jgi:hypothetical protein
MEALVVISRISRSVGAQSFGRAHRGRACIHIIGVSVRACCERCVILCNKKNKSSKRRHPRRPYSSNGRTDRSVGAGGVGSTPTPTPPPPQPPLIMLLSPPLPRRRRHRRRLAIKHAAGRPLRASRR